MPLPASDLVILFARAPVPGRCKTRLAGRHGPRHAAAVHRRLCAGVLRAALGSGAAVEVWGAPDAGHGFFLRCRRQTGCRLRRQPGGDLGRRMARAIDTALAAGAQRVVLVGSDCPLLDAAAIRDALQALKQADAVLQPAEDGGYVLLGTRRTLAGLLAGIDWSSGRECRQTLARLRRRGWQLAQRPTLWDVDHPRDLLRARRQGLLPRFPAAPPDPRRVAQRLPAGPKTASQAHDRK